MRPSWAIAPLGLVLAACGAAEPDRFSLRTPGAHTGEGLAAATAVPDATPSPKAAKPVTRAAEVEACNRGLPCGAKLVRTRRGVDDFVASWVVR